MHKSVFIADFQLDYASQSTNHFWKWSLKSPITLDLGAGRSVSGLSKHLSTQTVPLGQSLSYSQREEWKIIQHGWLSMRTTQEWHATQESHRQSIQMTLSAEAELAGELINERSERCCKTPTGWGTWGVVWCIWTEQVAGAWGCQGIQQNTCERGEIPSSRNSACQIGAHAAWQNSVVFPRESKSELSMALGSGLWFIPAVLLTSSGHPGDNWDQGTTSLGISLG